MNRETSPRIYCIPATEAPVVAVLRRGPTEWSHIGRWDLTRSTYEPGAWLHGRIFPRRSDLSPDGRLLCYFAHKPGADWTHGDTYVAVSRLPWLKALHGFGTCGTWTRGYYFGSSEDGEPSEIVGAPPRHPLFPQRPAQFATERRRDWVEAPDSPPRDPKDIWDERRNARILKKQPHGSSVLRVESLGRAGGEFGVDQAVDGLRVEYSLSTGRELRILDDVQWADWDREGRLLVATRDGLLQRRAFRGDAFEVRFEEDLRGLEPDPRPAPDWATRW